MEEEEVPHQVLEIQVEDGIQSQKLPVKENEEQRKKNSMPLQARMEGVLIVYDKYA